MTYRPYFEENRDATIRGWVLGQMLKGAAWAAILVFGVIGFLVALRAFARLLPDNPNAALDVIRSGAELIARIA